MLANVMTRAVKIAKNTLPV